MAGARALWHATGINNEDFKKSIMAVAAQNVVQHRIRFTRDKVDGLTRREIDIGPSRVREDLVPQVDLALANEQS